MNSHPSNFYNHLLARCHEPSPVSSLADDGKVIVFTKLHCLLLDNKYNQVILAIGMHDAFNGLYHFQNQPLQTYKNHDAASQEVNIASNMQINIRLWHDCFGHLHYDGIIHLSTQGQVRGLPYFSHTHQLCESCLASRQCSERFPKSSEHQATQPLQLIHFDLVGPLKTPSLSDS